MSALDTLKGWLAASKRTVWLAGAGLSVASGIRPYRGAPSAIWAQYVTELGTVRRFRENPAEWWAAQPHPVLHVPGKTEDVLPELG